ncbi:hypothetical protein MNBD_NITROSPINAE02-405 [hydrothermal vent metagenome]|uniref:Sirohydrochlorin cobaltochelatase n=1 Tax=hydrothermal vent metagenome TaxID=652676 RepID=A0A3B1C6R4_9ZZZZ
MGSNSATAIILMGHGSRVPGSGGDMEKVARRLAATCGYALVEICYMSRVAPYFPEALEKCVKQGAAKIVVIPYFLHSGLHLVLDIPQMIQEKARIYPDVEIIYGKHLGFDDSMVALVEKRIEESMTLGDVRTIKFPPREKYPLPKGELEFIPMTLEEAEKYRSEHDIHHDHHH